MQTLAYKQPAVTGFAGQLAGRHSFWFSVGLHLLPGLLTGAVYFLLAKPLAGMGLPSILSLIIAGILVIVPFELGVIAWAAKQHPDGPRPFKEMIGYRQQIPWWRYIVMVVVVFVATGLIFTLFKPATEYLQTLFAWIPPAMIIDMGMTGTFARSTLVWVTALNFALVAILFPIVEELYFRGFLLPRMPENLNGWAPLAHSFLFAAYHIWTPWMLLTRTVGLLPLIYGVRRGGNLYVGMIVHCLVNTLDVVTMVAFLSSLS